MDRTALITGCSSGIGRATAAAFLQEGWTVVATARDPEDIADLGERGAITRSLDVTKPAQCQEVIEDAVEETGRLDCLVNNAGFAQFGPVEDVPTRLVEAQYDVNLLGPHRLIRAALPHMREAGDGTIVNVSSVSGMLSAPGMGVYSSSKAALESLSDALRVEVADAGVDVALVEPGPVETQFDDRAQSSLDELERSETYAAVYGTLEDYDVLGSITAIPPADVATVILEAALSPDPDPRYTVGPSSRYLALASLLPDRIRDGIFSLVRRIAG